MDFESRWRGLTWFLWRLQKFRVSLKEKLTEEELQTPRKSVICKAEPETGQILSNMLRLEKTDLSDEPEFEEFESKYWTDSFENWL